MASKRIRKQIRGALYSLILSAILLALLIYIGIQFYFHGSGNRSESGFGLKKVAVNFLYWLEDNGHEEIMVVIVFTILGIGAFICLYRIFNYLRHLLPRYTVLGRSIRAQASHNETFSEMVSAINADLALDATSFEDELWAGPHWLLCEQVLYIPKIQRIYAGKQKTGEHVLMAADENDNILIASFLSKESLEEAVQYLQKRIPEVFVGNLEDAKSNPPQ
ncbi:MAG TPA: hypothetical protein DDY31_10020 [Lachnospiraceae bacterium]|nr:hypothetical protein [Lachnospiraceae bacterium]